MSKDPASKPIKSQFPYSDTLASIALKAALESSRRSRGKSLRAVARELNYKQPVVLSHMAHGRIPIPIERAEEIAAALGMEPKSFVKLALKQRYPDLDMPSFSKDVIRTELIDGLTFEASGSHQMVELTDGQKMVIREVMRDVAAPDRWLTPHEVGVIALIRQLRPSVSNDGLNAADLKRLKQGLR